jgi:hypothetical protein
MSSKLRTLKRSGIVGAASIVGLVPVLLATVPSAEAASAATLSVSPTTLGSSSTSTIGFTSSGTATSAVTLTGLSTSGSAITLPVVSADYAITVGGTADPATASAGTATDSVVLTLSTPLPASATAVSIVASGTTNPGGASSDYVSVADTGTATNTNSVMFGNGTTAAVPVVTSVNPNALNATAGQLFTVSGSGFSTFTPTGGGTVAQPTVAFVPVGTAAPTPPPTLIATGVKEESTTAIQGVTPALTPGTNYDVIVYNPTSAAGVGATYSTPSSASTADQVTPVAGLNVTPLSGERLANTTTGTTLPRSPVAAGGYDTISLASIEGTTPGFNVPTDATGLALNVTAVAPSAPGYFSVTAGTTPPTTAQTSTVNFQPGVDTGNYTTVGVTTGDNLYIQNGSTAATDVVVDVTGYFVGGAYTPEETRLLDTRQGALNVGSEEGALNGGVVYSIATSVTAGTQVALNVTAVDPSAPGNLRVFPEPTTGAPSASAVPNTAAVNYVAGVDSGSYIITNVGNNGRIDLYSDSTGTTNVVIDEVGQIPTGNGLTTVTPFRIEDTRTSSELTSGGSVNITATNVGTPSNGVPVGAVGIVGSVSDINPTGNGYLATYPTGNPLPGTATVNNYPAQVRNNSSIIALRGGQFTEASEGASTNSTTDVYGYIS